MRCYSVPRSCYSRPAHGDPADIAREAEFLVQTDILPLVMEASTLVAEELRKRHRELAYKVLRFAAIAGLGFLLLDAIKIMPTIIDKAIDSVEAAHESLSETNPPPHGTVHS